MARQTKPLSVKEIESAKPKEADYVLYDGDGLELLIKSSGSKIWQFRYIRPVTKKRAKSIGPYPSVTLADARNYRAESRSLLAKQIDPRNISRNNCAVQLKPKPILSSS
jgi:hypothetical protein